MLTLPQQFIDELIEQAREVAPSECCGIIAGQVGRAVMLFLATNAVASPSEIHTGYSWRDDWIPVWNSSWWVASCTVVAMPTCREKASTRSRSKRR